MKMTFGKIQIYAFQLSNRINRKIEIRRNGDELEVSLWSKDESARSNLYYKTTREVKAALDGMRLISKRETIVKQ